MSSFINGVNVVCKLLCALRVGHFVELKDALTYALEYEAVMLVNLQQRQDDRSDVIIALEDLKKYQMKDKNASFVGRCVTLNEIEILSKSKLKRINTQDIKAGYDNRH